MQGTMIWYGTMKPGEIKVGNLVRWTNPDATALGVIVKVYKETGDWLDGRVSVVWQDGVGSGLVTADHRYLEVISESR